jgi:monothiol glutaredoxin
MAPNSERSRIAPNEGFSMSDVQEIIRKQVQENPVILYMKGSPQFPQCGFSMRTSQALAGCGVEFAYVNVLEDESIRQGIKEFGNWPTIPQLYVNGELVGGCDIVLEMYESGELQKLVESAAGASAQQ